MEKGEVGEVLPLQSINEDLLTEILLRLSVKTLFRFKCVCKQWQSLISHKSFGNSFIKRSKELGFSSLVDGFFHKIEIEGLRGSDIFSADVDLNFFNTTDDVGMIPIDRHLRFLSTIYPTNAVFYSDNGYLLCAVQFTYIVCNPVTKQWITLPEPREHCQYNENVLLHVYNVDELCSNRTQFMVMCFIKQPNDLLQVELYCSKKGKWNKPKLCYYSSRLKEIDCITYFKGSAYWIYDERQIAVYSLKEESVGFVELSPDIRMSPGLGVSAGVLYFVETTPKCFQVWVFENGAEFSLKHSIEFENFKERFPSHLYSEGFTFHLMGFHPLDYQLVLVKCNDNVALYHMDKRSLEVVDDMNSIWVLWGGYYRVYPYFLPAWPTCIPCIKSTDKAMSRVSLSCKANICMPKHGLKITKKR